MKALKLLICMLCTGTGIASAFAQEGSVPNGPADPTSCSNLMRLDSSALGDPTATVTAADLRSASAPTAQTGGRERLPDGPGLASTPMPAHCEVFGKIGEHKGPFGQTYAIRFHLRLPLEWNGRFFFQGGGGTDGNIGAATGILMGMQSKTAIELGYAVASQDSGHDNTLNNDPQRQGTATFGFDDQARHNFGGGAIGPVTMAARGLIKAFYGRPPRYSYFVGGSKGGQEAFMAVQRFGKLFDGVLAGYPGFRLATAGGVSEIWDDQAFGALAIKQGQRDKYGLPLINKSFTDQDLALVSQAVVKACDRLDGTADGMIENFPACSNARVYPELAKITCPGPKTENCVSADQVTALKRIYNGARNAKGKLLYQPWPWDSGMGGKGSAGYFTGWRQWKLGRYDADQNSAANVVLAGGAVSAVFTSPPQPLAADPQSMTRYAMSADIEKNDAASKVKWGSLNESSVDFMNADSVDLADFQGHGGRLLIYHGVSDPVFSINDTIEWWSRLNAAQKGKAADFARLFPVPGMNHGGGGPSTDQIDLFGALVAWTEQGIAPASLVATAREGTNWLGRTRLLCPYPQQPRHVHGDTENATSFTCRTLR